MAEFKEVMTEAKRMCNSKEFCKDCDFNKDERLCKMVAGFDEVSFLEEFESIVMKWAEEHPRKKYPTWKEWIKTITVRKGTITAIPCHFVECEICNCSAHSCPRLDEEIPEDFAIKANIQPLEK